jgi:hypothetical protein
MDPETLETTTTIDENNEQVEEVPIPETIIVKRRGRPAGSKNKLVSSTGGTPETVVPTAPPDVYTALMKRLDEMDGKFEKRQAKLVKKERAPRKVAIAAPPPIDTRQTSEEPFGEPSFRIQGSPRTASRQLMEHLHSQQMERASAREKMYQTFLPI